MVQFTGIINKFGAMGEKTGWTYVQVPAAIAAELNAGVKKSYRVKGKIDRHAFKQVAMIPMGEGNFLICLNADMRKAVQKGPGSEVSVVLDVDKSIIPLNAELMECLADEPLALKYFTTLANGHQQYFSRWIEAAKTETTKANRIAMAVNALAKGLGYPEMLRAHKSVKELNKSA